MITLQCQLTPEDYVQAQFLHIRPRPWVKYGGIGLLTLGLGGCVATAIASRSLVQALLVFSPLWLGGLLYAFLILVTLPRNVRRIFAQQKTLQATYEAVISPDRLEINSEYGNTHIPWADFYRYKVGKTLILVYQSQAIFHLFPRRFFRSEADVKTFLAYLEIHLGRPQP